MSLRRFLVLSLTSAFPVVVGLVAYLALSWPYPPPHYDGKEPFALRIHGMRGIKMYLDPRDSVITPTILSTGSWEADEIIKHDPALFQRGNALVIGASVAMDTVGQFRSGDQPRER